MGGSLRRPMAAARALAINERPERRPWLRRASLSALTRQRHLTDAQGTAERTVSPARIVVESLTPRHGIREEHDPQEKCPSVQ